MTEKAAHIAAAILAGGKNSRMKGRNKAFLRINGCILVERTIKLLKEIFEEIIIVTNSPQDFASYGNDVVIIEDIIKDRGPLCGIHSALCRTSKEAVFFTACDMPFLHNAIIRDEIDCFRKADCDCMVPKIGALVEPVCAIYKKDLSEEIEFFLRKSNKLAIRDFLKTVNTHYLDLEDNIFHRNAFRNVNTPEDADKIKSLA